MAALGNFKTTARPPAIRLVRRKYTAPYESQGEVLPAGLGPELGKRFQFRANRQCEVLRGDGD
jgi:hypothetical protein